MKADQIRKKYLEFFETKGHSIIPSASLIPENDPSVLFTTAGMHPLVPFLMGEKHPAGTKLTSFQKCIRTGDIDEVGDDSHLTFFEMMGNWSLGDYWKKEAIEWSYEFLTDRKWLGLDSKKLAVSVFAGDSDSPFDQDAFDLWIGLGIPEARIAKLGKEDNWWPAGGKTIGPQGPDTEIFYWIGPAGRDGSPAPKNFDPNDSRWLEIWNDVFMQYERTKTGKYIPLKQKNVDTGFGLERVAAVMQKKNNIYETENLSKLIYQVKKEAKDYNEESARIIVDHLRSAIFIMADNQGVLPSNLAQGYIVRKLVRRAIRHAKKIGIPIEADVTTPIVKIVVDEFKHVYPELEKNQQKVINELNKEENGFEATLEKGLKILNRGMIAQRVVPGQKVVAQDLSPIEGHIGFTPSDPNDIDGKWLFNLYQTFGFPYELSIEELENRGYHFVISQLERIKNEFDAEMKKHQDLSKTASVGMFKGGLVDKSEVSVKYHTATHLLHQALREVLGEHVEQKGSNITDKRLRFDFSHPAKMTDEEKQKVEDIVNQKIQENLPVNFEEMTVEEARKSGAIGLFGDKYGDKVKVYTIGNPSTRSARSGPPFSREICGGPHVEKLGDLGQFKIKKEQASSAGIRRIKATLE